MSTTRLACCLTVLVAARVGAGQSAFVEFGATDVDDLTGSAVASVGDVDGDGSSDVVIASPGYELPIFGNDDGGRAQVFSGRTGAELFDILGLGIDEELGHAVSGVGDVDLDGVPDILVTRPGLVAASPSGLVYGGARVHSGTTGAALFTVGGVLGDDARSGHTAAGIDDVDSDGRPDFVLGAPYFDKAGGAIVDAGAVLVCSGAGGVITTLEGIHPAHSHYGWAVAGLGDVDGDNVHDLIIGAPHYDHPTQPVADIGHYQVRGVDGGSLGAAAGVVHDGYRYGYALASIGDLNNDGVGDYLIGAPGADTNGHTDNGVAFAKKGQNGVPLGTFPGTLSGEHAGASVAAAGDVTGDGVVDLLVGAPDSHYASPFGVFQSGVARRYSGATGAQLEKYAYLVPSKHLGAAVAGAGDVDQDGRADVLIGAPGTLGLNPVAGSALLYFGDEVVAGSSHYGTAVAGTLGAPSLALASAPELCSSNTLSLTSSNPAPTAAILFLGFSAADLPTSFGGSVLVGLPWVATNFTLPPGTTGLPVSTPCDATLNGTEVYLQLLCADPGAPLGAAFSQGLKVLHGT